MYRVNLSKKVIKHQPSGLQIKAGFLGSGEWTIDQNYSTRAAKIRNSHGLSQQLAGLFTASGIHLPKSGQKKVQKAALAEETAAGTSGCSEANEEEEVEVEDAAGDRQNFDGSNLERKRKPELALGADGMYRVTSINSSVAAADDDEAPKKAAKLRDGRALEKSHREVAASARAASVDAGFEQPQDDYMPRTPANKKNKRHVGSPTEAPLQHSSAKHPSNHSRECQLQKEPVVAAKPDVLPVKARRILTKPDATKNGQSCQRGPSAHASRGEKRSCSRSHSPCSRSSRARRNHQKLKENDHAMGTQPKSKARPPPKPDFSRDFSAPLDIDCEQPEEGTRVFLTASCLSALSVVCFMSLTHACKLTVVQISCHSVSFLYLQGGYSCQRESENEFTEDDNRSQAGTCHSQDAEAWDSESQQRHSASEGDDCEDCEEIDYSNRGYGHTTPVTRRPASSPAASRHFLSPSQRRRRLLRRQSSAPSEQGS